MSNDDFELLTEYFQKLLILADDAPAGKAILEESLAAGERLLEKNISYGNSALEPVRIFSNASPDEAIRVRIDDKLSRLVNHLTNVIRALVLESLGYQVTVTELTGWEHSLKNELILARKVGAPNRESRKRLSSLLKSTGVKPKLVRALESQLGLNPS